MTRLSDATAHTADAHAVAPACLYRALAMAEVVTWTLLLLGMFLKYAVQVTDLGARIGGGVHGFVFLSYVATTVLVAIDRRWPGRDLALGLGSAIIPFATVPFERSAERRGLLSSRWRLLDEPGSNPIERLASFALRHPIATALVTVVVVALVFSGLLAAGPPTEWFD